MSNLLQSPLWQPADLGQPIPNSLHANSVCLPTWRDNVGYEEGEPRVVDVLAAGYPRFVFHPITRQLFDQATERFGDADHRCHTYPSEGAARRCAAFMARFTGAEPTVLPFGVNGVWVVRFATEHAAAAKKYWQHSGDGISSRQAELTLGGEAPAPTEATAAILRQRLADHTGAPVDHVYLHACGMAAIHHASRAVGLLYPGRRTLQYGFPYVDTLKIQADLAAGAQLYPRGDGSELPEIAAQLQREPFGAFFAECPSNPLLTTPDLAALRALAAPLDMPIVVDDTLGSFCNLDVLGAVDILTTSLTKYFSGSGDVMAGSLVLNPDSPLAARLKPHLDATYDDLVWGPDLVELERNSRDYATRMARINDTARGLAEWLATHPAVARVHYPSLTTRPCYDALRRPDGGYSGLFSIILRDAPRTAAPFFDALALCKGPNLGTVFSLCCPYTILAHYGELDTVEALGVSRYLIRVSIGLEPLADLRARFEAAFAAL